MISLSALTNKMPRLIAGIEDQPACDGLVAQPIAALRFHVGQNVIRVRATVRSDSRDQHSNHGSQHFGRADVRHVFALPAMGRASHTARGPLFTTTPDAATTTSSRRGTHQTSEATAPMCEDSHIGDGLWREFHPSSWEKNPRSERQEAG